jgi:hypothetical protein
VNRFGAAPRRSRGVKYENGTGAVDVEIVRCLGLVNALGGHDGLGWSYGDIYGFKRARAVSIGDDSFLSPLIRVVSPGTNAGGSGF